MLFLVGLNFNNSTGSVNTPLCSAELVSCLVEGQVLGLDLVLSVGGGGAQ